MFWILLALFFCWLIFCEFRSTVSAPVDMPQPKQIYRPYVALMAMLALTCFWQPLHTDLFERRLSNIATALADHRRAHFHFNTMLDTLFDSESMNIGHAQPDTGQIAFQYPWCNSLMAYERHPEHASREELASLGLLTHESMHVRGERNEARTECQAVQRNFCSAKLLGVPERIARRNALEYYYSLYMLRSQKEGNPDSYYTDERAPGRAMDENLPNST